MDKKNKLNNGVCCDVYECVHNIDGCNCDAKSIKVTKGKTDNAHFCRTYTNKENSNNL